MTGLGLVTSAALWNIYPSVLVGCAALLAAYLALARSLYPWRGLSFSLGVLVILLALISPVDALGDSYLFSAHMLQHLLLLLAAPPLLLLGIPREAAARVLRLRGVDWLERGLSRPLAAWLIGTGVMWAWHLPVLYNAALTDERVHLLEHLSFLASAAVFWWPVLSPLAERRMRFGVLIPYLFFASAASNMLGILLAFAHPGLYPAYLAPVDRYGILGLIRGRWGITPAADQQAGGLLMWVAGTPAYLFGALYALYRWYGASEEDARATEEDARASEEDACAS